VEKQLYSKELLQDMFFTPSDVRVIIDGKCSGIAAKNKEARDKIMADIKKRT